MSRYAIPTIAPADYETAASAEIGVETRLFYSQDSESLVATLCQDVENAGTLTLDRIFSAPTALTTGNDFQAVLRNALQSLNGAFSAQFNVTYAGVAITSNSVANPTVVTTSAPHNLTTGQTVNISGVAGSTPTINGTQTVTVITPTTFSVPVDVTAAGTGGFVNAKGTATASFEPQTYVPDQSFNLPQALAVDLIPDQEGMAAVQIRTIDSLATVTNGGPGTIVELYALPNAATWIELGCTTDKNFQPPSPEPVDIPCGYNPSYWVKAGRDVKHSLDFSVRYQGFVNGVGRVNGQRFSVKAEVRKDKRVLSERFVLLGVRGSIDIKKPDGNGEVISSIKATYESFLAFC